MNCILAFVKNRPIPYHPRYAECVLRVKTIPRLNNFSHCYLNHVLRKGGLMHFENNIYTGQPAQADETKLNSIYNLVSTSPACACRSCLSEPKMLAVNNFSACRSKCTNLPHDPVEYPTEWMLWIHNHLIPGMASCITDML